MLMTTLDQHPAASPRAHIFKLPPRSRTLRHPGRLRAERFQTIDGTHGSHIRLTLLPGRSLFDGLVEPLAALGIHGASTTILGGEFETLSYCVAPPDPTGSAIIAYGAPIAAGRSYLVFGNATLGTSSAGAPLIHCHGAVCRDDGRVQGGHILPDRSIVGQPISVLVTAFDGFALRQKYDPETNISLLQPVSEVSDV
jgi:predicted DNA-binding protein with PD1-like motif